MTIIVLFAMLSFGPMWGQCLAVDGEWVTAADIAVQVERFAHADPDLRLFRAPFPGAKRLVTPSSLPALEHDPEQLADREVQDAEPFCVERRIRMISRESYWEAIQRAVSGKSRDEGEIGFELVDYERSLLPSGKLEFPVQALPPPILGRAVRSDDTVLWRGKLYYAEGRSIAVWARVRLWMEGDICVLARDVARGGDLAQSDCLVAKKRFPPFSSPPLKEAVALEGTSAARQMAAGEPIYQSALVRKPDVEVGRAVDMKVVNGGAQVRFRAKAAGSARTGETVTVTNPDNGKRIEGQVVGRDSVEVRLK
jgi:flagella basal body P-ring formation protein FlgA